MIEVEKIVSGFLPISLEDMASIRLMNRMDTKYITSIDLLPSVLELARKEYYIQQINDNRIPAYHTIYYDTSQKEMYLSHHNGRIVREKIRVRTYLESEVTFLEVKHKNNKARTSKKRIQIENTDVLKNKSNEQFLREHAWNNPGALSPHLENRFYRMTLVNWKKTERLTIDTNIAFHNFCTGIEAKLNRTVIIELKRDGRAYSPMLEILRRLRIHPQRISKYCVGSVLTNPTLKSNRLKEKIRYINKIEQHI